MSDTKAMSFLKGHSLEFGLWTLDVLLTQSNYLLTSEAHYGLALS